ncbi:C45 family autoproteolytic acyltransferase/hydolase [uncultured Thiohalocapsa sp.]|uniref:C45 family autoproteolytic acyltransferase/hydolase n=1 Tax=uncultured Thiohalocapsa sp. TaxID=768990 RepID=UPI0025D06322|nr:C45 family autoproteolytic acyltransferase/hydolase [uncultured Thiohalocapsa sp.]
MPTSAASCRGANLCMGAGLRRWCLRRLVRVPGPRGWALAALVWTGIGCAAPPTEGRLPVLSVATTGLTPTAVGARLGELTKAAFPDLEARWDGVLAQLLAPEHVPELLAQRVEPLRAAGIDAATRAELAGFAGALDLVGRTRLGDGHLSLDEFWLVQFLPDLTPLSGGSALALHGHRPGAAPVLLGRNLDLPGPAALQGLQAITRWQSVDGSLVSPGLAGFLGVLNGFNGDGVYAALLAAEHSPGGRASSGEERAVAFAVRAALTRDSAAGAARLLRRGTYLGSHSVLLGDAREAMVLELPAAGAPVLRRPDSPTRPEMPWNRPGRLAAVNCLVAADVGGRCDDLGDRFRWQRLRRLAADADAGATSPVDLRRVLLDPLPRGHAIFNAATVQSMIFEPASGDLLLYAAQPDGPHLAEPLMQRYVGLARTAGSGSGHPGAWVWVLAALLLAGGAAALWHVYPARSSKRPSETASTRSAT